MDRFLIALLIFAVLFFGTAYAFRRYAGLSGWATHLALNSCLIAAGIQIYFRSESMKRITHGPKEVAMIAGITASGLLIVLLTAFVIRLWGRWIGDKATLEERLPGLPGIRAWFSIGNVFVGTGIVLSSWLGYDVPPLLSTVIVVALLMAQPLLQFESPIATPNSGGAEDLSAEREKIISMLESGKLTPEEGAELLHALGESSRAHHAPRQVPLTGAQRLMMIGAALVTLGFFLPWLVINPGDEATRLMDQMKTSLVMPMHVDRGPVPVDFPFGELRLKTATMTLSGGDIQRGLGWAVLTLALVAALVPYVATTLDAATTRTVRFLCLGVGGLIVLYLATQNPRFVGVGLVIAVGGYVLEIVGAMRERHMAA